MASTKQVKTYIAPSSDGVTIPPNPTRFFYGNPFATVDETDQVGANYDAGMDGDIVLVQRTGEENPVTVPLRPGFQFTDEFSAAAIGSTPAAPVSVTGTATEITAAAGGAFYLVSPSDDLSAIGPRTSFGMFGWGTAQNNLIAYTDAGAVQTTTTVAASATVAFAAPPLNQINGTGGELAGATAGGMITVTGSAGNSKTMRVLSQPDNDTINVDPDHTVLVTEAVGPAITIAGNYSVELPETSNDLAAEGAGASFTLQTAKTEAGVSTPLFVGIKDESISLPTDPFTVYTRVYVSGASYSQAGTDATAVEFTIGSAGADDPTGVNPVTGSVIVEDYTRDDMATKPYTAAHRSGPYGDMKHTYFDEVPVCFTSTDWTIENPVAQVYCGEQIGVIAEDSEKPVFTLSAMVYRLDGDPWRVDLREKKVGHFRQMWTTKNFRDGVAGAKAMVLDVYSLTLTSAGDVATGVDAEPTELSIEATAANGPTGAWGAFSIVTVPAA
jgi:hypothetical protein